jgi:hypothetical protein
MTNGTCLTCFVCLRKIVALIGRNHYKHLAQTSGQTPNTVESAPIIICKTTGGKDPLPLLVVTGAGALQLGMISQDTRG